MGTIEALRHDDQSVWLDTIDRSDRSEGYVSLEVSPHLAFDSMSTLDAARHLRQSVRRPNLLIEVPATADGVPALQLIDLDTVTTVPTQTLEAFVYVAAVRPASLESQLDLGPRQPGG